MKISINYLLFGILHLQILQVHLLIKKTQLSICKQKVKGISISKVGFLRSKFPPKTD